MTTDSSKEPPQPSRLLKKKNMAETYPRPTGSRADLT
jgi:hypothetical protein